MRRTTVGRDTATVLTVDSNERSRIVTALAERKGGELAAFFAAHGYGPDFDYDKMEGKPAKLARVIVVADREGKTDALLEDAASHFGIDLRLQRSAERTELGKGPMPRVTSGQLRHQYEDLLSDLDDAQHWSIGNANDWTEAYNDLRTKWAEECPLNHLSLPLWCQDDHGNLTGAGANRLQRAAERALEALTPKPVTHNLFETAEADPFGDSSATSRLLPASEPKDPTRVFIVHGRDPAGYRNVVARIVNESTPLTATILSEKPHRGRSLLNKLQDEAHADCIAVIVMTGDDTGFLTSDGEEAKAARARQNVVLELGYFIGLVPPERIIVLREPGLDTPSDFAGVCYYDLARGWTHELARELAAVGVAVDFLKVPGS